jgi:putative ABC transport system permease protein
MLEFLFQRIKNNKWLFLCLLAGAIAASGILCAIPMYSNAVLQKMLIGDFEKYHADKMVSPGIYTVKVNTIGDRNTERNARIGEIADTQLIRAYKIPIIEKVKHQQTRDYMLYRDGDEKFNDERNFAGLGSISGYENHIHLVSGRLPLNSFSQNTLEVVINLEAQRELGLVQDATYTMVYNDIFKDTREEIINVRVVGIFTIEDKNELYWSSGRYYRISEVMLCNTNIFSQVIGQIERLVPNYTEFTYFFDYHQVRFEQLSDIFKIYDEQNRWNVKSGNPVNITFPLTTVAQGYLDRQKQLRLTLWILTIPMMMIIFFYTIMISELIIKNDRNEISVLKSRGAGKIQVLGMYVAESAIISGIFFISGPFIGNLICQFLGASNGFLEFINRSRLKIQMSLEVYVYSLAGALIFALLLIIPAIKASTLSIVEYKRELENENIKPLWQKLFLDVIILGLSLYGYYRFSSLQSIIGATGQRGSDLNIDPLLFFVSTLFILGISLVFIRVYPFLMRIIFRLGQKFWNPVLYYSLVNVSRSDKRQQSIMLFIILSLSFGIVTANEARTINQANWDKIMYKNGAEVVIEPYNNLKHLDETGMLGFSMEEEISVSSKREEYIEPDFNQFKVLDDVEVMTKVMVHNKATISVVGEWLRNAKIIAITPHEFGRIAWFRSDLLPYHINSYLNLLSHAPTAVLLSKNIQEDYNIRVGDPVNITWDGDNSLDGIVYGFVDYFPSINPYKAGEKLEKQYFAVFNYAYINLKLPAQPYEIWLKKQKGVEDTQINKQIIDEKLNIERVDYANQALIAKKNDPMLMGTNGVLTMCFTVTMMVTMMGFLIFWILSLREKSLKFGIFRAMGMTMSEVTMIMTSEQFLVSGVSIVAGILFGSLASRVFIPMLEIIYSATEQVPPLRVIAYIDDYIKVIGFTLIMLVSGLAILYTFVRKINVHQILKLGEDS